MIAELHTSGRTPDTLGARSIVVASEIKRAFEPIVRKIVGPSLKPSALSRELDIDKTLAARVVRAVRGEAPAEVLHEVPAPQGLRLFLDAAAKAGINGELRSRANDTIREFEQLINEFPGGRLALSAALSDGAPESRGKGERAAKQSIYKSMSYLLGYHTEVSLVTMIIQPSESGRMCDQVTILGKYDLRRLRASAPITVFGRRADESEPTDGDVATVETIDGIREPRDAAPYLLKDFCTSPAPQLTLFKADRVYLYTLGEKTPPINEPVTLVAAQLARNNAHRWRSPAQRYQWLSMIPRIPSRVLIADLYIHESAYPGIRPIVTTTMHGLATGAVRPDLPAFQLDRVDLATPLHDLGNGIEGAAAKDVPRYQEMLRSVFARVGWDSSRFRGYRCRVQYPVPMVSVTQWIELPERNGAPGEI